ncbi:MAG: putative nucleotide-diphospho-sugar transferase [bacterium]
MIILTAANADTAKDDFGRIYKGFSYKGVIRQTIKKAETFGYTPVVYDLGSLGIGEPFRIDDETLLEKGYYKREIKKGYKSKSLFKPDLVKLCLSMYNDLIVYLDGDAQLWGNIDEIATEDYDVGVTLRDPSEFESAWYREHFEIVRFVNAGVIFFRPTLVTRKFVDTWQKMTQKLGNDQKALNRLTSPDEYPEPNSVHMIDGVRIKYFPCAQYNFYYFDKALEPNIKIMHFKGTVRNFYPFDWKKRIYCIIAIPIFNKIRFLIKKIISNSE